MVDSAIAADGILDVRDISATLESGLARTDIDGKRVLAIVPDGTRSGPMSLFFTLLHRHLRGRVAALDFIIALGTHRPMSEEAIRTHLGFEVADLEPGGLYQGVGVFNHRWWQQGSLAPLGEITAQEIERLSSGRLSQPVSVTINKLVFDYDLLLVCGPVLPHEIVGFSGGNKYFFPGISGREIIDLTHWLGALITCHQIIGTKENPVRAIIDRAASLIPRSRLACCFVPSGNGCTGVFVGPVEEAWSEAVELARKAHVKYVNRRFQRVLAVIPEMYEDIWTAAKGMYKVEPIVADGGEVILYAPHISEVSFSHGDILDQLGYHVLDYYLDQWDRFSGFPWGVIAHSTQLKGIGSFENGREHPRIKVTLATRMPEERCRRLTLGYLTPDSIDIEKWAGREDEGILVVPHAGEMLFRLKD